MMQRQAVGGGTNSIGKLVGDLVDAVSNPLSAALRSRSRISMLAIDIVLAKITVNTSNSK